MGSTTDTTISLSWSVPSGSVVNSYVVMWKSDGNSSSSTTATITDGSTRYTIAGLEEDRSYTITVSATNAAGSAVSYPVTTATEKAGKKYLCTRYNSAHSCSMLIMQARKDAEPHTIHCSVKWICLDSNYCGRSQCCSGSHSNCSDDNCGCGTIEGLLLSACQDSTAVCTLDIVQP